MLLNIRRKLIIALLAMLIPLAAVALAYRLSHIAITKSLKHVEDRASELTLVSGLQLNISMLVMPANDYLITGDPAEKDDFKRISDKVWASLGELERHSSIKGNGTDAGFLAKIQEAVKKIQDKAEEIFAIKNPAGSRAGAVIMEDIGSIAERLIHEVIATHIVVDSARLYAASQEVESLWARSVVFMFVAFAVFASAGFIFAFYYSKRFVRPIEALRNGAEMLASGNLDFRVDVRTKDEVEALGRQFNVMAERLKGYYSGLEQEIRKRTGELRQERDKLFAIFNSMEDGVIIISRDYNVEFANPVVERDFGPYEGAKCYEYLHDRKEVCPWCPNEDVFAGNTKRWDWHSLKNNKTYDLIDSPLKNTDGSLSKLEIMRDITGKKRGEVELKKKFDELERFQKATVQREFRLKELNDRVVELEKTIEALKAKGGT